MKKKSKIMNCKNNSVSKDPMSTILNDRQLTKIILTKILKNIKISQNLNMIAKNFRIHYRTILIPIPKF